MSFRHFFVFLSLSYAGIAESREPSEFRVFRDKQQKEIEARILSITDDRRSIELERRDGASFEFAVTVLSLDDQQYIRDWLNPYEGLQGKLRVFGNLPNGKEINASAAKGISRFESLHAIKSGWFALLPDGTIVGSEGKYSKLSSIASVHESTVWVAMANDEGQFVNGSGQAIHPDISTAIYCVAGSGHSAALLEDGTVKVFGKRYDTSETFDAPGDFSGTVALASTQDAIAAVAGDGSVHCWGPGNRAVTTGIPGNGAVDVQGTIFNFLALTRGGEVYQWKGVQIAKARIPPEVEEGQIYRKIRSNGSTFAAQRADKTWIAWGMNGAGIVDHINRLGPTEEIAFFSEPGKKEHGYVIWLETE